MIYLPHCIIFTYIKDQDRLILGAHTLTNFGEGFVSQGDTYVDLATFQFSNKELVAGDEDYLMTKIAALQSKMVMRSTSVFDYQEKTYLGYWKKKQYHLLELLK